MTPPGLVLGLLVTLAVSQLIYAFLPTDDRRYLSILLATLLGMLLGRTWDLLDLPGGLRLGQVNLFPALLFVLVLQLPAVILSRYLRHRG